MTPIVAALVGIAVLVVLWVVLGVQLGFDWPLRVSDGVDGRPSTSKFQFFLWTAVILWGFSAIAARRWIDGLAPGDVGMPTNLFILMGLGAGTALGAKVVTVSRGGRERLADPASRTYRSLVADDEGIPALEKVQVLAWTLVAVGVFSISVWQALVGSTPPSSLPNVDDALLVLLGIGQVAYVGVKALPARQNGTPAGGSTGAAPATAPAAGAGAAPSAPAPAGGPATRVHDSL